MVPAGDIKIHAVSPADFREFRVAGGRRQHWRVDRCPAEREL